MFAGDDTSTEVVVLQDQTGQQQVSFPLIINDISLNVRVNNVMILSLLLQRIIRLYKILKVSMFPSTLNNSIDLKQRAGRAGRTGKIS
jgi:hypothetical protein